jgi:hypothetical protein
MTFVTGYQTIFQHDGANTTDVKNLYLIIFEQAKKSGGNQKVEVIALKCTRFHKIKINYQYLEQY